MPVSRLYKLYLSPHKKYVKVLKNLLGFVPGNLLLYRLAFRHKSVAQNVKKGVKNSNERLEFLGDAFEALVGAIYLDKGYNFTRDFLVNYIIKTHIDIHTLEQTETNFKSKLIEWCQRHGKDISFDLVENQTGESVKLFTVQASIDGQILGLGKEFSKKNAEKLAAEKACEALGI